MPPSTTTLVHRAPGVAVFDFACGAHRGDEGEEEATTADLLVLPWRGHFEWRTGRTVDVASANTALWCRRGHGYRVAHPVCGGDRCTVLAMPMADESTRGAEPAVATVPVTARLYLEHLRLRHLLATATTPLARDESVLAFAAAVRRSPSTPERSATATQLRQVHMAQEFLHANVQRTVRLAEVARAVDASPYHLARGFHRLVGLPMHRYQLALRARQALAAVLDGHDDLTTLALALGFCDHAHLTRVFTQHFGMPPSAARSRRW